MRKVASKNCLTLAPLLHAEEIGVFVRENGDLFLVKYRAAGGIREDGMLDDVLVDCLDEWVVGDGLDEDDSAVVARGAVTSICKVKRQSFWSVLWWMSWMDLNHAILGLWM